MSNATLSVLVFYDAPTKKWIAVCLEHSFTACAPTRDEIPAAIARAYRAEVRLARRLGEKPFAASKPAPEHYRRAFEDAQDWRVIDFGDPQGPKAIARAAA